MLVQILHHAAVIPALAVALISACWLAWATDRRAPAEVRTPPHRRRDDRGVRRSS